MLEAANSILRFLESGGPVLWLVAFSACILSALIIERYWFFSRDYPVQQKLAIARWQQRKERQSWNAMRIREYLVADVEICLSKRLPLIKILVALCPMLGLLGTVTGMMAVFDVIAMLGTGNVRAMAAGISKATIPTMAGLIVALPGLYFSLGLQRQVKSRVREFSGSLRLD